MTAEIAIMNKSGVALAADSAITITTAQGQKIYNTNKLFMLSKYHPVGIMLFNEAELMRVPWETIIKTYRQNLGQTQYDTLEEYGSAFIAFLNKSIDLFPEAEQERYFHSIVTRYLYRIRETIDSIVQEETSNHSQISEERIQKIIIDSINSFHQRVSSVTTLPHLPDIFFDELLQRYGEAINETIVRVFEQLPIPPEAHELLRQFSVTIFGKKLNDPNFSGIVIAGFGRSETFPSLVAYNLYGMANNVLRYFISDQITIDREVSAAVQPFAQDEMVRAFMTGIDPRLKQTVTGYLESLFEIYPDEILKLLPSLEEDEKKGFINRIQTTGRALAKEFGESLDDYSRQNHIDPVIDTVEYLPIDELAAMAESLVNLTSFKRRITMVPETVGGPIDVAVVSKGDGFIWIKRKHYFDGARNPQFLANYYR